jgi:GLPGLI family protein
MKLRFSIKIFLVVVSFLTTTGYAQQNWLITYSLNQKPLKSKTYRETDRHRLYILKNSSLYMDEKLAKRMEVYAKDLSDTDKYLEISSIGGRPRFSTIIKKDYEQGRLFQIEEYLKKEHFARETTLMKGEAWSLKEDTAILVGLLCHKATGSFAGRDWEAWYSMELPLSEGPYKFGGLPGLIVDLRSVDDEFHFKLKTVTRLEASDYIPQVPKYKMVDDQKFKEMVQFLNDNPLAQGESNGIETGEVSINGIKHTREELILRFRKDRADRNLIEKN